MGLPDTATSLLPLDLTREAVAVASVNFSDVAQLVIAPLDNLRTVVNGSNSSRFWIVQRVEIDATSWIVELVLVAAPASSNNAETARIMIDLASYDAASMWLVPIHVQETLGPRESAQLTRTLIRNGLVVDEF
jgi:hypothetical protein